MKAKDKPSPDKFFLPSEDASDDYTFLAPPRSDTLIKPLIDGIQTFEAMAVAIANAKKEVSLAVWVFNPRLPLRKRIAVAGKPVSRWSDLLREVADQGVSVRVLISDFDPILRHGLHMTTWRAYHNLIAQTDRLSSKWRHKLQVICSRHTATIGYIAEDVLGPRLPILVNRFNNFTKKNPRKKRVKDYRNSPGLWPFVEYNAKRRKKPFRIRDDVDYVIYPASHHQKICTVDGAVSFLGGIDIQRSRIDSQRHRGQFGSYWHDIHCQVEGTIVDDINRNFGARWDKELRSFRDFVAAVNRHSSVFSIPRRPVDPYDPLGGEERPKSPALRSQARRVRAQLHRTLAEDATFDIVPNNIRHDIARAYKDAIASAEHFIYIENQYLRSLDLADWIIDRWEDNSSLRVIIVLPVAPEEKPDRVTNHGMFLQHQMLTRLKNQLGHNVGLFSMAAPSRYKKNKQVVMTHGSLQVYVHSKLLIVDDVYCSIGSANANPRSFEVDTEIAIGWYNAELVKELRLRLWKELLGPQRAMATWKANNFLRQWNRIAARNARATPSKRSGFIVPHDINRYKGQEDSKVPDEFTLYNDASDPFAEEVVA